MSKVAGMRYCLFKCILRVKQYKWVRRRVTTRKAGGCWVGYKETADSLWEPPVMREREREASKSGYKSCRMNVYRFVTGRLIHWLVSRARDECVSLSSEEFLIFSLFLFASLHLVSSTSGTCNIVASAIDSLVSANGCKEGSEEINWSARQLNVSITRSQAILLIQLTRCSSGGKVKQNVKRSCWYDEKERKKKKSKKDPTYRRMFISQWPDLMKEACGHLLVTVATCELTVNKRERVKSERAHLFRANDHGQDMHLHHCRATSVFHLVFSALRFVSFNICAREICLSPFTFVANVQKRRVPVCPVVWSNTRDTTRVHQYKGDTHTHTRTKKQLSTGIRRRRRRRRWNTFFFHWSFFRYATQCIHCPVNGAERFLLPGQWLQVEDEKREEEGERERWWIACSRIVMTITLVFLFMRGDHNNFPPSLSYQVSLL